MSMTVNVDDNTHKTWKSFVKREGFGSLNTLAIQAINEKVLGSKKGDPIKKAIEPLKNAIEGLYKMSDETSATVNMIDLKLSSDGIENDALDVAREIIPYLEKGEVAIAEFAGKYNHSPEIIKKAVVVIDKLGLLGSKYKPGKTKKR